MRILDRFNHYKEGEKQMDYTDKEKDRQRESEREIDGYIRERDTQKTSLFKV